MPKTYDKNQPILLVIRRGRKGRGFSVAPVEDATNPAMCQTSEELGEVIVEMLDDENQPRVDLDELLAAAEGDIGDGDGKSSDRRSSGSERRDEVSDDEHEDDTDDDYDDEDYEDDEDDEDGGIFGGVAGAEDPADKLLSNMFSWAVTKGRSMSSKPRKPRSRTRRRRPRTSGKSKSR